MTINLLSETKVRVQSFNNEIRYQSVSISLVNKNNHTITFNKVVPSIPDTFEVIIDDISYCDILTNELSLFKFPIFNGDSIIFTLDFFKNTISFQSQKYAETYSFLDSLKKNLENISTEIFRNYSNPSYTYSLIHSLDTSINTSTKALNELALPKKKILIFYITELLKIKADLFLLLFSESLINVADIPDIEAFLLKPMFQIGYDPFIDFRSLFFKIINLTYLKSKNRNMRKLFLDVQSNFKKNLVNREYYLIAETELIKFVADLTKDRSTFELLKKSALKILKKFGICNIKLFKDLENLKNMLITKEKLSFNSKAPEIVLLDLDSNYFSLNLLRGKPIILVFWGTWCKACHDDIHFLLSNKDKISLDSFQLVFISLETNNFMGWKQFVINHKIPGKHLYAEGGFLNEEIKKYAVTFVPFHIIIDNDLKILHYNAPQFINTKFYNEVNNKIKE